MKLLIIGMLGAGKSTLAYQLAQKHRLPVLRIDEISRDKETNSYYPLEQQYQQLDDFVLKHENWIAEGCQKYLYERLKPTLVVYLKVSRLTAIWHFIKRFFQAGKLVGKQIDPALPVQAYHYRKPTLKKLMQWDADNKIIRQEVEDYLSTGDKCFMIIKSAKDLRELFRILDGE